MENNLALYEINDEIVALENALFSSLDEDTGEVDTDIAKQLNEMQIIQQGKLNNICIVNEKIEDNVALAKAKMKNLKEYIEKQEKAQQRLLDYVSNNLEVGKKYDLGIHSISWRKSEAVEIENENDIPKKYMTKKITLTPNKTKIKEAIKGGAEVKGCKLVERQNLQIK